MIDVAEPEVVHLQNVELLAHIFENVSPFVLWLQQQKESPAIRPWTLTFAFTRLIFYATNEGNGGKEGKGVLNAAAGY